MARTKNRSPSVKIYATVSEQATRYLDDLIEVGSYGGNRSEVAAYLIQRGIDDLLRTHVLERPARVVPTEAATPATPRRPARQP